MHAIFPFENIEFRIILTGQQAAFVSLRRTRLVEYIDMMVGFKRKPLITQNKLRGPTHAFVSEIL
jgi:hypothetical protein